ncbi:MAG: hypothetical protein JO103_01180, partial [Candidatus Eremiobacteraeota bacterium]|nr:hypothetical protein [Candidatus Eremiobacteraeota bacterium]MBV9408732.1 hypothetical protein [Candidatus Eremiobacteraeota bacterium]
MWRTSSMLGQGYHFMESERDAARIPAFDLVGVTWLMRRVYDDAFYATSDGEYGAFAALPYPDDAKRAIGGRVLASIRTIAAFSAWYPVLWSLLARAFALANVLAVIAAIFVAYDLLRAHPAPLAIGFAVTATVVALLAAHQLLVRLPRRWPYDVLVLVVACALFTPLAELAFARRPDVWWLAGAAAAATSIAVVAGFDAFALTLTQAFSQLVTRQKITAFPEEEIIQTTASVLAGAHAAGYGWRVPEDRARDAENLEWIARRCESELVARYLGSDAATDTRLREDGRACAAAFRARRRELAFPGPNTAATLTAFLWNSLRAAASGDWAALERRTPPPAEQKRRANVLSWAGNVVTVALPVAIAVVVARLPADQLDPALGHSIVVTAISWAVLSVLAMLNPRQFEQQASTAKTLGDLLKQGRG